MMAPLATLLNYCDAALRHATDFQAGVDWVKHRDEQCRAGVVELSRQQWPIGEAFEKSYPERELMWLQPPTRNRTEPEVAPPPDAQEPGSGKKARTKAFCKKWNDNRGCSKTDCQDYHGCDVLMSNNKPCGSREHNRMTCPNR